MKAKKRLNLSIPLWWPSGPAWRRLVRVLLPSPGSVIFTLLALAVVLFAQSVGALPLKAPTTTSTSTGAISYQGRLADANGNPLTGTYNVEFRLYDVPTGGAPLWTELWTGSNGVEVSDGLFNVMLGSLTPIDVSVVTENDTLYLGITVGTDDEMTPRVQLGSVPWAMQASTVPDGSISTEKIADGAVTSAKLNVTDGLTMTGDLTVNGMAKAPTIASSNSTKDNPDLTAGNMGRNTWTITTGGSPLEHWNVEETWMHFGGNLYFVRWTLGIKTTYDSNRIVVPATSHKPISLANWNTQEFTSSRFSDIEGGSYLTGVSSLQNLINLTHWSTDPTLVDFVVFNGIGGVSGAQLVFSNPSSSDAVVRSFSIQGFVYTP